MSVKELRERCAAQGKTKSGNKADLVAKLLEVPVASITEECAACAKRAIVGFILTEDGETLCQKCQDRRVALAKAQARAERFTDHTPAIDPLSDDHPDLGVRVEVHTEGERLELVDGDLVPVVDLPSAPPPVWQFRPPLEPIVPDPNKNRTLPSISDTATVKRIYAMYERQRDDERRGYTLPMGYLGVECERACWYKLRWGAQAQFNGQAIRRFERGNREEDLILSELRSIGVEIWSQRSHVEGEHVACYVAEGWHVYAASGVLKESCESESVARRRARERDELQIKVTALDGHVGGRLDAVGRGFEEAPKTPHVVEAKNLNDKGMKRLAKMGVEAANPKHYAQTILYMLLLGLKRAVYFASGKNDDSIHFERIRMDKATRAHANALLEKAERVIRSNSPPDRISSDPTFFKCKFCDFRKICHESQTPEKNCRTCVHSTPVLDGSGSERPRWQCSYNGAAWAIPPDRQRLGCDAHLYIPGLLEPVLEYVGADNALSPSFIEYHDEHDVSVFNAVELRPVNELVLELETSAVFSSRELDENPIDASTNYAELRARLDLVPF